MEPWGTSDDITVVADRFRPIAVYCYLSETKHCNHRSAVPHIPKNPIPHVHTIQRNVVDSVKSS